MSDREEKTGKNDNGKKNKGGKRNKIVAIEMIILVLLIMAAAAIFIQKDKSVKEAAKIHDQKAEKTEQTSQDAQKENEIEEETEGTEEEAGDRDAAVPDRSNFAVQPGVSVGTTEQSDEKIVYLTLDDGPSDNTQAVLDILDKYNIKAEDIKSFSDLEKVFALIKKNEPNLTILIPGYGTILSTQYYLVSNNGFRPGVHMDYGRNEKIDNVFETEEYMDALKRIRKWYLKGYLRKDIFGETEPALKRVKQGKVFAYTTKGKPGIESQDKTGEDNEMVCVKLGKASISYNSISGHPYVITKNTISPELAMKVLNLFYTDADIMNLLSYGVEGVHYKKLDNGFITYVGKEKKNPFLNNAWNMPNQFITYVWEGNDKNLWENLKKFNEESIQSCELGFNFDFSEVVAEYASVREIYKTYNVILENGLVNPEDGLQHMLQEMRENGMNRILTLEKKQFESWEKGKKKEEKSK